MVRKLRIETSWGPDNDYDWAQEEACKIIKQAGSGGIWESDVYTQLCKRSDYDRPTWLKRSPGQRAVIVSNVIPSLFSTMRVEAIPELNQATGRRCLRAVNVLDSIVAAIEVSEHDA